MLALLMAIATAGAVESPSSVSAELLAPDLKTLLTHAERLEGYVSAASATGDALGRVQNRWLDGDGDRCESDADRSLAARARVLGSAQRDMLQSARSELARVQVMAASPTVAPLVDAELRRRVQEADAALDSLVAGWTAAAAWQQRFVEPALIGCEVSLTVGPGLAATTPMAAGEGEPVALLSLHGGLVCSDSLAGRRRSGGVVVVPDGLACYDMVVCDCEPLPVTHAEVLGPGRTQ